MASIDLSALKADLNALHTFAVTAHDAIIALRDKLAQAIGLASAMPDNGALQAELDAMDAIVRDASGKLSDVVANAPAPAPAPAPEPAPIAGAPTGTQVPL